jgi:hypothetical protein
MKDYPILYEMFREDIKKNGGRFEEAAYGGFKIIDYMAFDDALRELEKHIQKKEQELEKTGQHEIILVEFARSNYREALRAFSDGFLRDVYFFYIEADVESCVQRICQRVTSFAPENRPEDHHYVPEEILRSYFNQDDWEYMAYEFKRDFEVSKEVVAYRNIGSYIDLLEEIKRFMGIVFKEVERIEEEKQVVNTGPLGGDGQTVDTEQPTGGLVSLLF